MNAEFFALAFLSALNPKLLAMDLLLIENRRARAMFLCLLLGRPEATKALLKHSQDWLLSHALQLMAAIALLLGAYLAISGLVRLS